MAKVPRPPVKLSGYLRQERRSAVAQVRPLDDLPAGTVVLGTSSTSTTLGAVVGRLEVLDLDGNRVGFLPLYGG